MRQRDTILIVDDMEINRVILDGLFQEEYHLLEAENGEQALLLLRQYHENIAIMLLDVVMPVMDGYKVLQEMGANGLLDEVPVVVITADNSLEGELRAFDLGASDIIVKPFEPHVVKRRVHNIIELYLHKHNLEDMVEQQAQKLRESNDVLVDALSSVIEYRSLESGQHIKRIRLLTQVLLEEVCRNCPEYGLDKKKIEVIASASALHDIGKIAIEDKILNKPGRLTVEEFEIIPTDKSYREKLYIYQGQAVRLVPQIYHNGWLALCLELADTEEPYTILTVNLEETDAIGLPDRAFIDINNNPDAMEFLELNHLATDTGYRRGNGWVEYPMVHVNLPLVFQHCPESFNHINIYT